MRWRAGSTGRWTVSSLRPRRSDTCSWPTGFPKSGRSPSTKASTAIAWPRRRLGMCNMPVVGNVAALVPHKGQRYLIDATHLVVQQMPDARFVILGEGKLREQLEHQVRAQHLEQHVLLPGFRTDVLGCIKGLDLFVMS